MPRWFFLALLGVLVALWLWGGIATNQVDSLIWRVISVFKHDGNPSNFHYPALVIYLLCIPYGLMSWESGPQELRRSFVTLERSPDSSFFSEHLPGHLVIVLFALLGVVAVKRAARGLGLSEAASIGGALCLGTALLWVAEAHLITVDLPLAALCVATAAATVRTLAKDQAPSLQRLAFIGALGGLSTSAKYNGGIILLPVILALFWRAQQRREGRVGALLVPGFTAIAVFLATNPFILLDFGSFVEDFAFEVNHARMGHDGYDVGSGFGFHWRQSLVQGWGSVGLALSSLGGLVALFRRDLSGPMKLLVIGFPVLFFGLIGASALTFQRYAIPLLPFLALAVAVLADSADRWLRTRGQRRWGLALLTVVVAGVVAPNGVWALAHVRAVAAKDVRRQLIGVLRDSGITRDKPIFCGRYGASSILGGKLRVDGSLLIPQRSLPDPRADIYLFDAFSHERHVRYEPVMEFVQDYEGFEDWSVLRFSPYEVPYEDVPISQKSLYSPYLPDLAVRDRGGPMIELYFANEADVERVVAAAERQSVPFERMTGSEAYFLPAIAQRARTLDQ